VTVPAAAQGSADPPRRAPGESPLRWRICEDAPVTSLGKKKKEGGGKSSCLADGKVTLHHSEPPPSSGTASPCWEKPLSAASRWVVCLLITGLTQCYYQEKFLNLIMSRKQL